MNNEREIQRSRNGTRRISKQMMAFVMALTLVVSMLCPIIAQAANVSVQQIRVEMSIFLQSKNPLIYATCSFAFSKSYFLR